PGVETASRPACRKGRGSRVADGSAEVSREARDATGPAGSGSVPGRNRTPEAAGGTGSPKVSYRTWRGSGPLPPLQAMDRDPYGTRSSTPRGDPRRHLDDGGGGAEEPDGRGGRHHHLDPRASWCSYHQVTFTLRLPTGLPVGGGAGLERRSTPRGDSR